MPARPWPVIAKFVPERMPRPPAGPPPKVELASQFDVGASWVRKLIVGVFLLLPSMFAHKLARLCS